MRIGWARRLILSCRSLRRLEDSEPAVPPREKGVACDGRLHKSSLAIVLHLFFGFWVTAPAAETIRVSVDQDRTYVPGDLVELEIVAKSGEYERFALREPNNESLRYLETQEFPIAKTEKGE